ncbi:hypothetical protein WDV06_03300 [Streptomyces racemochromogenes]|uniref:Uncharacterized protein n=1 Tax=Streptomyces racemochromogenes TaxID=67353 RepID=A0ABW7P7R6_9ACTN
MRPAVQPRVEHTLAEPSRAPRATVDGMCDRTHRYLADIQADRASPPGRRPRARASRS